MAINDIVRVQLQFNFAGQVVMLTPHFIITSNSLTPTQQGTEINTFFWTYVKPIIATGASFRQIVIKKVKPTGSDALVVPITGQSGSASGLGYPSPLCGLWSLRTGFASRRRRGRLYFPAVGTTQFDRDGMNSAGLTAHTTARDNVMTRYGPGGAAEMKLGVFSRLDNDFYAVNDIQIRNNFAVQRRRNIGVGI